MSRRLLIVCCVIHYLCYHTDAGFSHEDQQFWNQKGKKELEAALKLNWNEGIAKNVVIFVGDGMGPNTITAARIYKSGENSSLSFETFPHIGLLKTYSVDKQVPDSASTATALFCGIKNNFETAGVDASVKLDDCAGSLKEENHVTSILEWAQRAGKDTGFVTTTRITHATPSALYAHVPNRRWECDTRIPPESSACSDIARQLVEQEPGRSIKVIMGGGRQCMSSNVSTLGNDPIDKWACTRGDGRDLIQTWANDKLSAGYTYQYVSNTGELDSIDIDNTDYVLGIFANGHMKMDHARDKSLKGSPSLKKMTETALKLLLKCDSGFVLAVEGGLIDYAHHRGHARMALDETIAFDEAIHATMTLLRAEGIFDDTLVIVTSDHTHALSINGNPPRGNNILGASEKSKVDGVPYTTLSYATGASNNYHYYAEMVNSNEPRVFREDPSKSITTDFEYSQQAGILTDEALHGGGEVIIYATGPMAHLFHSVHEQNYVAHVVAYASRTGPYHEKYSFKNAGIRTISVSENLIVVVLLLSKIVSDLL